VIPLPGGFQPRAAVAYSLVVALEVAWLCGAGERLHAEIDVAAAHVEQIIELWGPEAPADSLAKQLAHGLYGTIPQIAGSGLTSPIAYRWKTQINENAKMPCFAHELPELDHNEIVGWEGCRQLGRFSAVFLDDSDLHPRIRQRIELTRGLIEADAAGTYRVESIGQNRTERLISLVLLGDLVSVYLAVLREVDPGPVPRLERLKSALARG
jgi:glucose/mannose-6-phosphate isomerase